MSTAASLVSDGDEVFLDPRREKKARGLRDLVITGSLPRDILFFEEEVAAAAVAGAAAGAAAGIWGRAAAEAGRDLREPVSMPKGVWTLPGARRDGWV